MNETNLSPQIAFRIPGDWSHPGELQERLPEGFRLDDQFLVLPDGMKIELIPMAPDRQFPQIFKSSCRQPPTAAEQALVARYTVNVGLSGPGGSLEAAARMMEAGAALVRAGGAGVFIDNSALAHGGNDWIEMTDDGGSDAISFAFVSIIRGRNEVYTMGMQALGFPNLVMRPSDIDAEGETIIDMVRYVCGSDRPVAAGHVLMAESGESFQAVATTDEDFPADSPMHNPFGRLKIVSLKDIAEGN